MVKDIFGRAIENLRNHCLICFIDAPDECEEDEVREMVTFFEHLGQLQWFTLPDGRVARWLDGLDGHFG
jgi:hypothetical protein